MTATVVKVQGSAYRRPGARLIVTANGRVAGSVSGGCLERELVRTALWHARSGPVVRQFDSTLPDEPGALGCGGVVDVLLERSDDGHSALFSLVEQVVADERRAALATVFRSTDRAIPIGAHACSADTTGSSPDVARYLFPGGSSTSPARAESREVKTENGVIEVLVEPVVPAPHLFVLGAGFDAAAVVGVAQRLGWAITVWDATPSFQTRARFAGMPATLTSDLAVIGNQIDASDTPLTVVMGHNLTRDHAALRVALQSQAVYIGILGPRHRTASLMEDSPSALEDPRVHSPAGLDVGAETPEEIALSIVSEMLGCIRRASYASLRLRETIHGSGV